MSKSKYWIFVINNYTETDISLVANFAKKKCSYLAYAYEVGESGTPHMQGYLELKARTLFKSLKKQLPRSHLERRKASAQQALDYCKKTCEKEGDLIEFGTISKPKPGRRTDLEEVRLKLKAGETDATIADEHFGAWVKYRKAFTAYRLMQVKRNWPCTIIWITGESGSGKSRHAHEHWPDAYYKSPGKWWDGYQGEDVVVFDDFRSDWCTYGTLLRWADRYPCLIETKGGTAPLLCKQIIITTCKTPQETFPAKYDRQLERRISEIIPKKLDTGFGLVLPQT
ncbi:MAG: putative viral replication protein [Cressdnaviricota sp.]|nr:MAG: putative viral replication protein [Cressdnaviricota sp.]